MSKNSTQNLLVSERCFYVPDDMGTDKRIEEAIKRVTPEIEKVLGRKIKPIRYCIVTNRDEKPIGLYYIFTPEKDVFRLLHDANRITYSKKSVADSEDSDDGWNDTPVKLEEKAKPVAVKSARKAGFDWADDSDDDEPVVKKDEVKVVKKEEEVKKEEAKIEKMYYLVDGEKRCPFLIPYEIKKNPDVNPYSLFCAKLPAGITDRDIQNYFAPFVSNPTAKDNYGNPYPQVVRLNNGSVYVNFQPRTDDACCAARIQMKGFINGMFVLFKEARNRR